MIKTSLFLTTLAASVAVIPATRASADAGDFVAGAIVGAIVNHAARNAPRRKVYTTTKRRTYVQKRPSIPATQTGRQIQSSLNYFGFNAGSVDGQLGSRTRQAVSQYQAYLGYPVTGHLSSFEQDLLINSYNRAQAGGSVTMQRVAANPEGTRGLLKDFRTEMAGGVPGYGGTVAPQTTVVVASAAALPVVTAAPATTTTTTTTTILAPETTEADVSSGALPDLFGGATTQASLASHCNTVSLLTSTNGGFTTVGTMTDPNIALNEQFCLARTYAISAGEQLAQGLGVTADQIASHCDAYGEQMKPHVVALSLKDRDEVIRDVSGFVLGTGIAPQNLAATAKVCLSVGYRTDNMDEALGSALILTTLGEKGYGELMGHHLYQGFGVSKRSDLAWEWYDTGIEAATTKAVFAPGQGERVPLLRAATLTLRDGVQPHTAIPAAQKAATLPSFSVSQ